jgi:hypothetical protein
VKLVALARGGYTDDYFEFRKTATVAKPFTSVKSIMDFIRKNMGPMAAELFGEHGVCFKQYIEKNPGGSNSGYGDWKELSYDGPGRFNHLEPGTKTACFDFYLDFSTEDLSEMLKLMKDMEGAGWDCEIPSDEGAADWEKLFEKPDNWEM